MFYYIFPPLYNFWSQLIAAFFPDALSITIPAIISIAVITRWPAIRRADYWMVAVSRTKLTSSAISVMFMGGVTWVVII